MKPISRFEQLAQRLIEGSFSRLLGGRLEPVEVATQIAYALEDSQDNGQIAGHFQVHLHPDDFQLIRQENPELVETLSDYVVQLVQRAGLSLANPPEITLVPNESLRRQQILVQPEQQDPMSEQSTQVFRSQGTQSSRLALIHAVDAYLIVDGKRHVPLDRPVITIGRRTDNDIILDAATVSRQHAQLRWRHGRFVIYDLGSRGGTMINGQRIKESVLHPGDIIYVSDIPLIYGEGVDGRGVSPRPSEDDSSDKTKPYQQIRD